MDEGFLERRQAGARRAFGRAIYEGGDLWFGFSSSSSSASSSSFCSCI
jgi:hypothetical protein